MLKTGSPPAELAVHVLVVVDASIFRNPWNENKAGDLGRSHWSTQTASHTTYQSTVWIPDQDREEGDPVELGELITGTNKTLRVGQYRRHIATLKRQVAMLERQMALLQRRVLGPGAAAASGSTNHRVRFVAKGLKSHRNRLGFSAADYGRLVGVSAQSVYNWEQGHASPRAEQLKIIATLRGIGKREAQARLHQLGAKGTNRRRKS